MDKNPTRADAGDVPEARSLTSAVFTNLKVEILSCRLKPGEKLHIGNLAKAYDVTLYPFILDGVAGDRALNQADGLHPTAAGVDVIVSRMLPKVEDMVARVPKSK